MNVSVALSHPHEHYTNLDVIRGTVVLRVPNPTNISSVVVKLEGESKTRLWAPIHPNRPDKTRPVLEVHKFLYKTQVLWPTNIHPEELQANPKASFPINAGNYEYPFSFKIPLNTQCQQSQNPISNVSFANALPEFARPATHHVKSSTLPPTLNGFPGEAEIKYFVKVTVNRPQFFKENPRATANFTLLPIEPPRPAQSDGEAYARRQHQFIENISGTAAGKAKQPSLFDRKSSTSIPSSPSAPNPGMQGAVPPRVAIDARLPNPAILTSNQDLPLRLLFKNISERNKNIYLQMLQIELIGYTKVRAHEASRTESNSWILCSFSNMNIPLGLPTDPLETETPINPEYWSGKPISNSLPPTFTTCNLSRHYELEVRVGLGYGSYKHGEDQLVVLPLRLPVKVFSGIAPPKALLEATLAGNLGKPNTNTLNVPTYNHSQAAQTPTTPTHSGFTNAGNGFSGAPMQPSPQQQPGGQPGGFDDAPPSYEEAVGQDLPPINGYRGDYRPPPVPAGAPSFPDEKRR